MLGLLFEVSLYPFQVMTSVARPGLLIGLNGYHSEWAHPYQWRLIGFAQWIQLEHTRRLLLVGSACVSPPSRFPSFRSLWEFLLTAPYSGTGFSTVESGGLGKIFSRLWFRKSAKTRRIRVFQPKTRMNSAEILWVCCKYGWLWMTVVDSKKSPASISFTYCDSGDS